MDFECTRCGKCCRDPTMNIQVGKSDIDRWINQGHVASILVHLRFATFEDGTVSWVIPKCRDIAENIKKAKPLVPTFPKVDLTSLEGNPACLFLSNENLCIIEQTKPRTCRTFPYCNHNYACPGIRAHEPNDENTFQRITKENSEDYRQGVEVYPPSKFIQILQNLISKRQA